MSFGEVERLNGILCFVGASCAFLSLNILNVPSIKSLGRHHFSYQDRVKHSRINNYQRVKLLIILIIIIKVKNHVFNK